jgi:hypothetical protein
VVEQIVAALKNTVSSNPYVKSQRAVTSADKSGPPMVGEVLIDGKKWRGIISNSYYFHNYYYVIYYS